MAIQVENFEAKCMKNKSYVPLFGQSVGNNMATKQN